MGADPADPPASPARRRLILHPVLFAAFPVLFLLSSNVREGVGWGEVVRPLLVVVGAAVVLWLAATLVLRSAARAGLAVSALVLLFFSYGRVYGAVEGWAIGGVTVGRHAVLLAAWIALGALAVIGARRVRRVAELTSALNVVAAGLVLLNLVTVTTYEVRARGAERAALHAGDAGFEGRLPNAAEVRAHLAAASGPAAPPDIYYVVLEEYAGERVLRDDFAFDDGPFLRALADRGFCVAHESTANYPRTSLSLASSLNMEYLDFLTRRMGRDSDDAAPLDQLIAYNRVGEFLKSAGYRYVQIGSWWGPTATSPIADQNVVYGGLSEFSAALYRSTVLQPLRDDDFRHHEWKRVQFQFEAIEKTRSLPGPTFVFAHLLVPHGPFVFDADGSFVSEEREASRSREESYAAQVAYANDRVLHMVDALLAGPADERPVVIVQSDEGPYEGAPTIWSPRPSPAMSRKFPIMNAYYLPGPPEAPVPQTITPVNSFRLVLSRYLGADLAPLPDRNYVFRSLRRLYDFTDVTDLVHPRPPG